MILFTIQAYRAWEKYCKGDVMMVAELEELEEQIFPSVTICKGPGIGKLNGSLEADFEFNSMLHNWLQYEFDTNE